MGRLTDADIQAADLTGWQHRDSALRTRVETGDFAAGLALVNRIGAAAEAADHHPDLLLSYPAVEITLTSHDSGGVTDRDVSLARAISALAADAGLSLGPPS